MPSFANFNFMRRKKLNQVSELQNLRQTGAPDPEIANDRRVPAFPPESISLKTVWWPVARDMPTPMPISDPQTMPANSVRNPYPTCKLPIDIDPTRTNIPPNTPMSFTSYVP